MSAAFSDSARRRRRHLRVVGTAVAAVAALVIAVEVAVGATWNLGPWRSESSKLLGDATWPAGKRPAPDFRLFDQQGRLVTLRSERGRTIVLAFLYSHCREACPTIGAELTQVQRSLPPASQPELVIVSVDPGGDTPTSVRAFAANEGWNGHWRWLLGTKAELASVWRAYGIEVKPGGKDIVHSGAVYLIDGRGDERSGYVAPFLVQNVVSDLRTLNGSESNGHPIAVAAAAITGLVAVSALLLLTPLAATARPRLRRLVRRRRIWVVAAAVASAAVASALLLRPASSAPRVAGAVIPTSARHRAASLASGAVLVPPRIALSAQRGRVVYINFFASWCIPCRQEAPAIRSFVRGLDPRQAVFVGVDVSDKRQDALAFIHKYQLTYPILVDQGQVISREYDVLGLPTTVAIDPLGSIGVQLLGPQTTAELRATLRRLAVARS